MLVLNETELRGLLTWPQVIDALEDGFCALGRGDVLVPPRLQLSLPSPEDGILLQMPAYARALMAGEGAVSGSKGSCALGTKIVSFFPHNAARMVPTIQAVYLFLHPETGALLALMDGRFITAMRTAATSAVATKYMALAGAKQLAIFGAGVQARFHMEAMRAVVAVERIRIVGRTPERATRLAEETQARFGVPCTVASAQEAVTQSNLICTCTTSVQPLFDGRWLQPGTHINAVGAFTPATRELDTETVRRGAIIVDAESAAGREAGELQIALAEGALDAHAIRGTLADVVSGKITAPIPSDGWTLFKSCGHAIEDLATARLAYHNAQLTGAGQNISFQVNL